MRSTELAHQEPSRIVRNGASFTARALPSALLGFIAFGPEWYDASRLLLAAMNQIEREYQSKAARPGDPPLLNAATAIQFIDECVTRGIEVLGFDSFRMLPDERLQPLLEDTLDFEWQHLNGLTYSEKL